MSKLVKQMQMDVLAKTFEGVKNMVLLSATRVDSQTDNSLDLQQLPLRPPVAPRLRPVADVRHRRRIDRRRLVAPGSADVC